MYTFENIDTIKSLKYPGEPSKKQIKKMESIKNGVFAEFDYSNFMHMSRPANESLQTYYELKTLKALPIDEDFVKEKDEVEKCFENICIKNGIEYPKELVTKLVKGGEGIIQDLKWHHNRPRPIQLSKEYEIKLTNQLVLDSMKTPSFPSGHSATGILISKVLANKYPQASQEFIKEGKDISYSRNIGRAHYPSDSKVGESLGNSMYQFIKDKI
jgi:hypothetical protein